MSKCSIEEVNVFVLPLFYYIDYLATTSLRWHETIYHGSAAKYAEPVRVKINR